MEVILYNNKSDKRVVNKSITQIYTCECKLLEPCSLLMPKIRINYPTGIESANYCYIPFFGRYYYIKDIEYIAGGQCIISMSGVDVLMTYKSSILNLSCAVERNENAKNEFLQDNNIPILVNKNIQVLKLSNNAMNLGTGQGNENNFVLVVSGGV